MSDQLPRTEHVRFIEFKRPDGRKEEQTILCPKPIAEKAEWLWANGYRLTAELIPMVNQVSLVADYPANEEDVAVVLCRNGPEMDAAVDRLIASTYEIAKGREEAKL